MKPVTNTFFYSVSVFVLLTVLALWSWNTVAELFGGPQAQYNHVLAAMALLFVARWSMGGHGLHHRHDHKCAHGNARW